MVPSAAVTEATLLFAAERAVDALARADTTPEFNCKFSTALATGKQLGVLPMEWAEIVVPS